MAGDVAVFVFVSYGGPDARGVGGVLGDYNEAKREFARARAVCERGDRGGVAGYCVGRLAGRGCGRR